LLAPGIRDLEDSDRLDLLHRPNRLLDDLRQPLQEQRSNLQVDLRR